MKTTVLPLLAVATMLLPLHAAATMLLPLLYAAAAATATALIIGAIKVGGVNWTDGWWDGCAMAGRLVCALCAAATASNI